jgi:hypothetical protein
LYGLQDTTPSRVVSLDRAPMTIAGDGEYHAYCVVVPELKPSMYFWVAALGDASVVDHVQVDRIYIEKQSQVSP